MVLMMVVLYFSCNFDVVVQRREPCTLPSCPGISCSIPTIGHFSVAPFLLVEFVSEMSAALLIQTVLVHEVQKFVLYGALIFNAL